jgi:hypothetical protein
VIIEVPALDTTRHTAQYELLRSQVTGSASLRPDLTAPPRGVGLAWLLREGMPGWLNAIDAVIRASHAGQTEGATSPPVSERPAARSTTLPWLPGAQHHDLTTLLTSLVLSTRRVQRSLKEGHRSCQ